MSSSSGILDDLPPGIQFAPPDEQIVELYLLRRVRGQPDLLPGLIVDDDAATNTQPWKLFKRHGRPDAPQAFFFVHTNGAPRPDRRCRGGGTWKSQKCEKEKPCHEMVVDGERVKWSKHNLNLHMESDGSCGWVMHEYTVAGSSLKMCSISFTGNGQKRKRVPDGYDDDEHVTQRPRVDADASGSGTTASTFDQGFRTAHASSDEEIAAEMVAEMTCEQPSWEFQAEQVQQTINASSAPQQFEPSPPPWTTTTTFSQESSLAQEDGAANASEGFQHLADSAQDIAAMIYEMTDGADLYLHQEPGMDQKQSSCGVPTIGDTDVVYWEGFGFF
ncbi:hypothetical protein EJB05_24266, partial [Eragrostis curvula]